MRRPAILVATLLMVSCKGEGLSEQQTAEAHDVATDAAYQVVGDSADIAAHEARIAQLEQRFAKLEFCSAHPDGEDCS
jgi:hypothetical protein